MKRFDIENLEEIKDYKPEDLEYFDLFRNKKYLTINKVSIYYLEDKLPEDEKIILIDKFTDGSATYMLNLIDEYIKSLNSGVIKMSNNRCIIKSSFKSWKKKYDTRDYISDYSMSYHAFGIEYKFNESSKTTRGNNYNNTDDYYSKGNIINIWFHWLIYKLIKMEENYYLSTDEREIKINKLKDYRNSYLLNHISKEEGTEWENFGWSNRRDISDETLNGALIIYQKASKEINELKDKYTKELEEFINKREKEIKELGNGSEEND